MKSKIILGLMLLWAQAQAATWYVATNGNDAATGTLSDPLLTLDAAITLASPGDVIELRGGTYPSNEVRVTVSNLTIRSFPGEWAILAASTTDPDVASCIWYSEPDVNGGTLENLELTGGYYYGLSFETNWDWGVPAQDRHGASNIIVRGCHIHHTGRDCIKIKPGCDGIQILGCELDHSGIGPANQPDPNAEGIDNVNGDGMVVRNCHIHHTSTTGVYAKGGADGCLIEENLIRETGEAGILLGFYTDAEYFDEIANPNYQECRNSIARNNIVMGTGGAGIGFYASENCRAEHNTVITASPAFHSPLFCANGEIWISSASTVTPPNINLTAVGNIFVDQSGTGPEDYTVQIRPGALTGTTVINH
ncbi:MAG: right-handed parallel beta-helix repeat-containing protein, partial [Bacteroidia bacterium]